jgi:hypothetical protein
MTTRPVRSDPGLAVAVIATAPLPFPVVGATVIQGSVVVAVHVHPVSAVTLIDTRPAAGEISTLVPLN